MPSAFSRCSAALLALSLACVPLRAAGPPAAKGALPAVEKDVPYAEGGDQQKLDLYLPGKRGFTTAVFTYGGGWHTGSRKSVTPVGKKLQALGLNDPRSRVARQARDPRAYRVLEELNVLPSVSYLSLVRNRPVNAEGEANG
jgi:hypothetical protein